MEPSRLAFLGCAALGLIAAGPLAEAQASHSSLSSGFVEGRVVDREGRGIAGASISFEARFGKTGSAVVGPPSESVTDGVFHRSGLTPDRRYYLVVDHSAFARKEVETTAVPLEEPARPLTIELRPGVAVSGGLVDSGGRSLKGAEAVLLETAPDLESARRRPDRYRAVAGSDGRFVIENLPAGRFDLEAWLSGYVARLVPGLEIPAGQADVDLGIFALERGIALEGRVVGPLGEGIEGVRVRIVSDHSMPFLGARGVRSSDTATVTDSRGFFVLPDQSAGTRLNLMVSHPESMSRLSTTFSVAEGELATIVLHRLRIEGRVVDEAGAPVARAEVSCKVQRGRSSQGTWVETGEDGSFRTPAFEPGTVTLSVSAQGFPSSEPLVLEDFRGDLGGVEIVLRRSSTFLAGRVRSPGGQPVSGARVRLETRTQAIPAPVETDAEGAFRLEGVPTGPAILRVERSFAKGSSLEDLVSVTVEPGSNRVEITLSPRYSLSGSALGGDGTPLAGVLVEASAASGRGRRLATSGADGGFLLTELLPGSYWLELSGKGLSTITHEDPVVIEDGPRRGLVIVMDEGAAIKGRILGVSPGDLGRVLVWAFPDGSRGGMTAGTLDPSGGFRVEHLARGHWLLFADRSGSTRRAIWQVEVGAVGSVLSLDLDLSGDLAVSGRFRLDGEPAEGALRLEAVDRVFATEVATDSDGGFRVEGLRAGTYRASALRDGRLLHVEALELSADRALEIDVDTGEVSGRVVGPGGSLAGTALRLRRLDPAEEWAGETGSTQSEEDGSFAFKGLAAGAYRLEASLDGYAFGSVPVDVPAEGDLEVSLGAAPPLELEAVLAGGKVSNRLRVTALGPSGEVVALDQGDPGEDGRLHLTRIPAGEHTLAVWAEGTAVALTPAKVPGPRIAVTLARAARLQVRLAGAGSPFRGFLRFEDTSGEPVPVADGGIARREIPASAYLLGGTVRSLPAGTLTVTFEAEDGRTWSGAVSLVAGEVARLMLE